VGEEGIKQRKEADRGQLGSTVTYYNFGPLATVSNANSVGAVDALHTLLVDAIPRGATEDAAADSRSADAPQRVSMTTEISSRRRVESGRVTLLGLQIAWTFNRT
jgi:hypothetical protein